MEDVTKMQPLGGVVLAKVVPKETQVGSILIPLAARGRADRAVVVAHGPGRAFEKAREPMDVKVGDRILFDPYQILAVFDASGAHAENSALADEGSHFLIDVCNIYGVEDT